MTRKKKNLFYVQLAGMLFAGCTAITVLFWSLVFMLWGIDPRMMFSVRSAFLVSAAAWGCYILLMVALVMLILYRMIFLPVRKMTGTLHELLSETRLDSSRLTGRDGDNDRLGIRSFWELFSDVQLSVRMFFKVTRILMSSLEVDETIPGVLNIMAKYFDNAFCCLICMDTDGYLKVKSQCGFSIDSLRLIRYRPGDGMIGKVYVSLKAVVVNNTAQEGDGLTAFLRDRDKIESLLFLPVVLENQTFGVIGVGSRERFYFSSGRIKAITQIAEYIAIFLRNAKVHGQLETFNRRLEAEVSSTTQELTHTNTRLIKKVRELKVLYDILMATSTRLNFDEVMGVLMDKIPDLIDAELFHFLAYDKGADSLKSTNLMIGQKRISGHKGKVGRDDHSILFDVFNSGTPFLSNSVDMREQGRLGVPESYTVQSLICLPVKTQFETAGVFCVGNKLHDQFNRDDLRIMLLLANQLGEIFENITLYQEKEKHVADLLALQRISSTISSSPILSITLKNITHIIAETLKINYCVFLLYDEEVGDLVPQLGVHGHHENNIESQRVKINDQHSLSARVFREGKPVTAGQYLDESRSPGFSLTAVSQEEGSLMIIPLKVENQIIGVLRLGSDQKEYFSGDHLRFAGLIADQSAIIIENAKLYQRIRDAVRELEQLNAMKNEFISVISHELRTPITTISGFVNILLKGDAGPLRTKQRKFLEITEHSVGRLTSILNDILDVSRIETGRVKFHFKTVSLEKIVRKVVESHKKECQAQKISVKVGVSATLPVVSVDEDRILQVFRHLIENAIKFSSTNGKIEISAFDRGDFVQVDITDNGSGIAEENHEKIFEKFYQVDMSLSRQIGGTGLGLSIVRSIVELHGGKVWVESVIGKGSVFKMIIPKSRPKELKYEEENTDR